MDTIWVEMVLVIVSILANAFFAGSEIALVSARPSRLAQAREERVRGADIALTLKRDPEAFLATLQIAITLIGTLASAVGGVAAVEALEPSLRALPVPGADRWGGVVALGIVVFLLTFASLVVGELTPKALALRNPERAACLVARPIRALVKLLAGPGRVLTWSAQALLVILGQRDTAPPPLVSEDEVKYLVREGAAQGVFEQAESDLIHRVLRLTDTPVRAIMVPRPSILALGIDTPPGDVLRLAADCGHTRIPVYRGSIDDTVGVVTIKDLLRCAAEHRLPALAELLHDPVFVPEVARAADVLRTFQRHGLNLAMVVDEYGRVVGLLTVEDLAEDIVGDLREEREPPGPGSVSRLADGSYIIDGMTTVRDLGDRVGLDVPESLHYQTVAGLLLHELKTMPRPGMTVRVGGYVWTIVEMSGPRVAKVRVEAAVP
jgi:putative hemolysin